MEEPLVDWGSVAIVSLGLIAVLLRRGQTGWGRMIASRLLTLGAVGLLVNRWVASVATLPAEQQQNWRGGSLMICCGVAVLAAVEMILAQSLLRRLGAMFVVCGGVTAALLIAGQVLAAIGIAVVGLIVIGLGLRLSAVVRHSAAREPVLISLTCGAALLLWLATWHHVVEHETFRSSGGRLRQTPSWTMLGQMDSQAIRAARSSKLSSWPRSSALWEAWQQTDWRPDANDSESAERVARQSWREHRLAAACCVLILVIASSGLRNSRPAKTKQEVEAAADDALSAEDARSP